MPIHVGRTLLVLACLVGYSAVTGRVLSTGFEKPGVDLAGDEG